MRLRQISQFEGGDRERGLREVGIAEKSLSRNDAKVFWSFIEVYFNKDYGKTSSICRIARKYPE